MNICVGYDQVGVAEVVLLEWVDDWNLCHDKQVRFLQNKEEGVDDC